MKRASRRQQPEMNTLWFTTGIIALIPKAIVGFPPRSASWNEEMEKRSRQRVRDQVALMAFGAESRMRSSARGYP